MAGAASCCPARATTPTRFRSSKRRCVSEGMSRASSACGSWRALLRAKRDEIDREPRDQLSRDALDLARRLGDRGTLAYALAGRWAAMLGPAHARGRETDVAELVRVAEASGDAELAFEASLHCLLEHVATGDAASFVAVLDKMDRTAQALQQPAQLWAWPRLGPASRSSKAGSTRRPRGLRRQCVSASARSAGMQSCTASSSRSRCDASAGSSKAWSARSTAAIVECPTRPVFRCVRAALAVELDDLERARLILVDLAGDGFAAIPVNNDWSLSTALLAEVIAALADASRVRRSSTARCSHRRPCAARPWR